jgi:hypothetical protein
VFGRSKYGGEVPFRIILRPCLSEVRDDTVSMCSMMSLICGALQPSRSSAVGTVWLTIFINRPPTSFFYLTRAMSHSTSVVWQSIMKPMVP